MSSTNYSWDSLYRAALAETDLASKFERIKAAEDAILLRRRQLAGNLDFCDEIYESERALLKLAWLRATPSPRDKSS